MMLLQGNFNLNHKRYRVMFWFICTLVSNQLGEISLSLLYDKYDQILFI